MREAPTSPVSLPFSGKSGRPPRRGSPPHHSCRSTHGTPPLPVRDEAPGCFASERAGSPVRIEYPPPVGVELPKTRSPVVPTPKAGTAQTGAPVRRRRTGRFTDTPPPLSANGPPAAASGPLPSHPASAPRNRRSTARADKPPGSRRGTGRTTDRPQRSVPHGPDDSPYGQNPQSDGRGFSFWHGLCDSSDQLMCQNHTVRFLHLLSLG